MVLCAKEERPDASGLGYLPTARSPVFADKEMYLGLFDERAEGRRDSVGQAPRYSQRVH
jgi:hypothetical protein